ncbi:MBL fold metallo-hydrolase [Asanoa sp. NPDC049573]|uniref:MBL fold metallo-hydrolase n=1 Tax=Asanoa sp. NPDC049573 TaxID=3155396 RepID=UPI00342AF20A
MSDLAYATYVAPEKPVVSSDLAPGESGENWSPSSATLIQGTRDAVLVDALTTMDEGRALADWVAATGKNLTTIYATHGHGDHFFGATEVLDRFPDARLVATAGVVDMMRSQTGPRWLDGFWRQRFPNQITDEPVVAEVLTEPAIELEGERLEPIELGHTDTDHTTALHAPSIRLVTAGDAVYSEHVHLYLAEAGSDGLASWLQALTTIEELSARTVIAGHKREDDGDSPEAIAATRDYLLTWKAAVADSRDARGVFDTMVKRYPDRVNRNVVWHGAKAAKN